MYSTGEVAVSSDSGRSSLSDHLHFLAIILSSSQCVNWPESPDWSCVLASTLQHYLGHRKDNITVLSVLRECKYHTALEVCLHSEYPLTKAHSIQHIQGGRDS